MSYNIAYTSQFGDPDGILWMAEIWRDFNGDPVEVGLDAEQPLVIEWQETKPQDAVCPSLCTLKIVNDSDRQMVPLAIDEYAFLHVYRDGKLYWTGVLDQGVYEEPYSYLDSYITEITFSDFGALNRFEFKPFSKGGRSDFIVSLYDIVSAAFMMLNLDIKNLRQNISMILPGWGGNYAHLHHLYVNSRRFEGMTYREALEKMLQPLSYRIVQRGGLVYLYDAEWMFANGTTIPVVWKGCDARLSFGEVYGGFELSFERESKPVIADGTLDPDDRGFVESSRYYSVYKDDIVGWGAAFFIDGLEPAFAGKTPVSLAQGCVPVRLRGKYSAVNDACLARMIQCYDQITGDFKNLLAGDIVYDGYNTVNDNFGGLFSVESSFLPKSRNTTQYRLRISLDMLFSPKYNPFDTKAHTPLKDGDWKKWNKLLQILIPSKLELLSGDGTVLKHYRSYLNLIGGEWEDGAGDYGDMGLCFYNEQGTCPFGSEWVTNHPAYSKSDPSSVPEGVFRLDGGEYVSLPPVPGRLRLSVSDKITVRIEGDNNVWFGQLPEQEWHNDLNGNFRWQLFRNPKITLVRALYKENEVDENAVEEKASVSAYKDSYSEESAVGTAQEGVSPACLGLLMNSAGEVYEGFVKNGVTRTLLRHRLNGLLDQLGSSHSILGGTAELNPQFGVRTDASTNGVFLETALVQNPRQGTEEVVMTRISPGGDRYAFAWSGPVSATEAEGYSHQWGDPVCVVLQEHYDIEWSDPVCERINAKINVWNDI